MSTLLQIAHSEPLSGPPARTASKVLWPRAADGGVCHGVQRNVRTRRSAPTDEHRRREGGRVDGGDEGREELLDADHAAGVAAIDVESACARNAVDEQLLSLRLDGVVTGRDDDRRGDVDLAEPWAGVEVAEAFAEIACVRQRRRQKLFEGPHGGVLRGLIEALRRWAR